MDKLKNSTEKLCSFYISDLHLVTMILPYINKELNEKANIVTILENDIEKHINMLISKLNLKNEKKILKLNWKGTKELEEIGIMQRLSKLRRETKNIVLVKGNKEYIEKVGKLIESKEQDRYRDLDIKVIDCYEVSDFNENIKEILDRHDRVLNTSGEKEISEMFTGYKKIDNVS